MFFLQIVMDMTTFLRFVIFLPRFNVELCAYTEDASGI